MKKSIVNFNPFLAEPTPTIIPPKGEILADYDILYHLNDCYDIKNLFSIQFDDQLLFQRFNNKIQQMNLVVVDSIFPILLAKIAIQTLISSASTFQESIDQERFFVATNSKTGKKYYNVKFKLFINHLLYSNISTGKAFKGEMDIANVYYQKNDLGEIQYYSILQQFELQELLLKKIRLETNLAKSFINKNKASLNLIVRIP